MLFRKGSWRIPPIFTFLQQAGNVPDFEMLRTFNNGIGMIAVVPESTAPEVIERLTAMNEPAFLIGEIIERREAGERLVWG